MIDFLSGLFSNEFMPHGHCFFWDPAILWTSVISDLTITLSYYSIPVALIYFVRKRSDLAFNWLFIMFAAFIFACGTTHLLDVLTIWVGEYRLSAAVKAFTAAISATTAIVLWPLMPKVLSLPGPKEWRETAAALAADREALEHRVENRTSELQAMNEQLRRSNRDLDQFAYVASHDLKAPLRAIENLVNWLNEDLGPVASEESKENLGLLKNRVKRMENLLDGLLHYSRIGRMKYSTEKVSIEALVLDAIELLAPPASFKIEMITEMPTLDSPRPPLEIVIRNLIGNALKHHNRQDGHVRIASEDLEHSIAISISDDGPGIAPEYHQTIFEMFQTLRPRDEVEGSGMGLALVKKTVETHGGSINLTSAPGAGSTFCVIWPKKWYTSG